MRVCVCVCVCVGGWGGGGGCYAQGDVRRCREGLVEETDRERVRAAYLPPCACAHACVCVSVRGFVQTGGAPTVQNPGPLDYPGVPLTL